MNVVWCSRDWCFKGQMHNPKNSTYYITKLKLFKNLKKYMYLLGYWNLCCRLKLIYKLHYDANGTEVHSVVFTTNLQIFCTIFTKKNNFCDLLFATLVR